MSDEKLRELERRWKETGAVEDEAAFLLERVRAGELTQERLELAAYCRHEGATAATSQPPYSGGPKEHDRWLRGLLKWGHRPLVKAGLCSARHPSGSKGWCERHQACVTAAQAWLDMPTEGNRLAAEQVSQFELPLGQLTLPIANARAAARAAAFKKQQKLLVAQLEAKAQAALLVANLQSEGVESELAEESGSFQVRVDTEFDRRKTRAVIQILDALGIPPAPAKAALRRDKSPISFSVGPLINDRVPLSLIETQIAQWALRQGSG
tara:strand:- start:2189 stop:2989 length:801 start_codon:yes stop_codon:yes gene_type:complete